MLDKENAVPCENYSDFLDRLIWSKFVFSIDLDEHRLYVASYQYRESSFSEIGFHYYGKYQVYYLPFKDLDDISDIINEAVDVMKSYMKKEISKELKKVMDDYLC